VAWSETVAGRLAVRVTWPHLRYAALLTVLVNVLFVVVYGGADYLTGLRAHHLHLFIPAELSIPLWPWTILVYDSLYLLFVIAPFVLTTRESFRALALTAAGTIVVAGVLFLLLPAELGFAAPVVTGPFKTIFTVSDRLNLDYNLVPSLHVALAMICLQAFWAGRSTLVRVALATWGLVLALSTLFTHQHHLLDVVTGAGLARAMFLLLYEKRVPKILQFRGLLRRRVLNAG
jgi:membrane-associated phospholipid phosphatase